MSQRISLREAERNAFRTQYNDGLWDILLGCVFLMFPVVLYLSPSLGDFWSSVMLVPLWGLAFLVILLIRKLVVAPRIGKVKFGPVRLRKLTRFTLAMLIVNILAFVLGLAAAANFGKVAGQTISIVFGLLLLVCFSLAAYFLEFNRLYVYGLLIGLSPLVGEWMWTKGYAAHHGFPVTFGTASGVMILIGLVHFVRLLHDNPIPHDGIPSEKA
jgi:hypothetical protein